MFKFLSFLKFWGKDKNAGRAQTGYDLPAPIQPRNRKPAGQHKSLGTFEITREIGRGAMGIVYLGKDVGSGRDVAIKTMTLATDFNANALADAKERFMREARILTWLHHPDIVTIYDVGEEHGLAYIAMEFLKGVELTEHVKPGTLLPLPKTLEIMARAADALAYAHDEGIVHRDVKPGNIMYDSSINSVKVTDFGISRLVDLNATRVGLVLGTPLYMSPEQVMGKQIDSRSDLFSLGTTFYQMVTGDLPFEGKSEFDVMCSVAKDPHKDILSIRPDLPPCVCAVINRAMEKDPDTRYQSGYEMAEAIRQCTATP